MPKQQILLIHGGTTYESHDAYIEALKLSTPHLDWIASKLDWKNGLQAELGDEYLVYLPQMPNKQNAQYEEWKIVFEKLVTALNDNFILVGHSLGAIFIVKYLSENEIKKNVKKTCLLGTPYDDEGMVNESLVSFLRKGDLHNLERQAGEVFFYHSEDDFIVPFDHFVKYQHLVKSAHFRPFKDRNHFIQESIPELVLDIKNIKEFGIPRENEERRDGGCGIVFDPMTQKYAVGRQTDDGILRLFSGGVDADEDIQAGVLREVTEESGLYDFGHVEKIAEAMTHYYNSLRDVNRVAHATCFLLILKSSEIKQTHLEEHEKFA